MQAAQFNDLNEGGSTKAPVAFRGFSQALDPPFPRWPPPYRARLDGEAGALTRKAVEMAMTGDLTALRLCIERLSPPPKDALVTFPLPNAELGAIMNDRRRC